MAFKKMPEEVARKRLSYRRWKWIIDAPSNIEAAHRAFRIMDDMNAFRSQQASDYARDSLDLAVKDSKRRKRRNPIKVTGERPFILGVGDVAETKCEYGLWPAGTRCVVVGSETRNTSLFYWVDKADNRLQRLLIPERFLLPLIPARGGISERIKRKD